MRIIGGTAKGRSIETPAGKNTRPTGAMVREAVFGMLGDKVHGAMCLDLFCGSGAMALEAVSRGAKGAVLVDSDAKAVAVAKRNASALGFAACRVYRNDYLKALDVLQRKGEQFDIVFLDPPYAQGFYAQALAQLPGLLPEGAIVVCEHDAGDEMPVTGYQYIKTKTYGKKAITLLQGGRP